MVVVFFGYAQCPDVCPTTLAELAAAKQLLGPDGDKLQGIFVTVDPERDSAEVLKQYVERFDPSFVGGTGTPEQLEAVRREYGIAASRTSLGASYGFSHSSFTYLIDREGKLRALMPYGHASGDYAHDVKILLGP